MSYLQIHTTHVEDRQGYRTAESYLNKPSARITEWCDQAVEVRAQGETLRFERKGLGSMADFEKLLKLFQQYRMLAAPGVVIPELTM